MGVETEFISSLRAMFARDEYLIPYVWAQRLLRRDNYQMASQALLEDFFYDTLGDYLNRYESNHTLERRQGAEPWDYKFDGVGFSHKEGMQRLIVSKWQAGAGPKNKVPLWPTWTFDESVTFSYTKPKTVTTLRLELPRKRGGTSTLERPFKSLTHAVVDEQAFNNSSTYVAVGQRSDDGTRWKLTHLRTAAAWRALDFRQVRSLVTRDIFESDLLWFSLTSPQKSTLVDLDEVDLPLTAEVVAEDLRTGVYLLDRRVLVDLPQACNNKAHFVTSESLDELMRDACSKLNFVPMPLWPALYTDMTPPNLYQDLRSRYDTLFQARSSNRALTQDLIWASSS